MTFCSHGRSGDSRGRRRMPARRELRDVAAAADDDERPGHRVAAVGERDERAGRVAADAQLRDRRLAADRARPREVAVDDPLAVRPHAEHGRGAARDALAAAAAARPARCASAA